MGPSVPVDTSMGLIEGRCLLRRNVRWHAGGVATCMAAHQIINCMQKLAALVITTSHVHKP